jgi:hypothetical protein
VPLSVGVVVSAAVSSSLLNMVVPRWPMSLCLPMVAAGMLGLGLMRVTLSSTAPPARIEHYT